MKNIAGKCVRIFLCVFCMICLIFNSCERYTSIIEKEFIVDNSIFDRPDNLPDFDAMLSSFQGENGLFLMTFYGNFDELIDFHHQQILQHFARQDSLQKLDSLQCSLFAVFDKTDNAFVGRNFDNRQTQVLVGLFIPDDGYTSIGFVPMIEFGFDERKPFNPESVEHRKYLLHSAAFTVDGINEKGVAVTVASVGREEVKTDPSKPDRFLLHLTRNILDHADNVESAIDMAFGFNMFDNTQHSIDHHLFIADPHGHSAVLEWADGEMHIIRNSADFQIATNKKIVKATQTDLIRACNRYKAIYKRIAVAPDTLSWQYCMDALRAAKQINQIYHFDSGSMMVNTEWSAVFDLNARAVNVCLNSQYEKVYHFHIPE